MAAKEHYFYPLEGPAEEEFIMANGRKDHKDSEEKTSESVVTPREIMTAPNILTWGNDPIPCHVNSGFSKFSQDINTKR